MCTIYCYDIIYPEPSTLFPCIMWACDFCDCVMWPVMISHFVFYSTITIKENKRKIKENKIETKFIVFNSDIYFLTPLRAFPYTHFLLLLFWISKQIPPLFSLLAPIFSILPSWLFSHLLSQTPSLYPSGIPLLFHIPILPLLDLPKYSSSIHQLNFLAHMIISTESILLLPPLLFSS